MKRFLFLYLRQRLPAFLLFFVSCGVFAAVFGLYRLPLGAALYPALICGVLWLLFLAFDLHRAWRKHKTLQEIAALPTPLLEKDLPDPDAAEDEDYQRILFLLEQEQRELQTVMTRRYSDTVEYFTLWAHQIKTPLASLRLTLQNEDDARTRRLLADLARVEQYVEMALVYLRLDGSASDYVLKDCDLDEIIRGAVKKLSGQFIDRKLRLEYHPIHDTALTDEKWLSFVVEQVLTNALKYTAQGSISITLEDPMTLCIRDTGIGIAPEDLPRVFEKGYTGYNGRTDKRASGIGLYLCKRICENLGHSISIQSTLGEGTCVKIGLVREKIEIE